MRLIHALHRKKGTSARRRFKGPRHRLYSAGRLINVPPKPPLFRHRALTKV
jgi:hypothetical protein